MDKEQFRNWHDFADRMARQARPGLSGPTKSRLVRSVSRAIQDIVERHGLEAFEDWDDAPYLEELFETAFVNAGILGRDAAGEPVGEVGLLALCCVKAGFDLSVTPSAGVVGSDFTAGLIHRMYPEGMPEFVKAHFDGIGLDIASAAPAVRVWL